MNERRYCSQCGARREPWSDTCCPAAGVVKGWYWEDWGRDQQALVRLLMREYRGGAPVFQVTAKMQEQGWDVARVKAAAPSCKRPHAACFSPVLASMGVGGFWLYLPDRAWDGLPPFLRMP